MSDKRRNNRLAKGGEPPLESHPTHQGAETMNDNKSRKVTIRLTEYEYQKYKLYADKKGVGISEYIRTILENKVPLIVDIDADEYRESIQKITSIGNFQAKLNRDVLELMRSVGAPAEIIMNQANKLNASREELGAALAEVKAELVELKECIENGISQNTGNDR